MFRTCVSPDSHHCVQRRSQALELTHTHIGHRTIINIYKSESSDCCWVGRRRSNSIKRRVSSWTDLNRAENENQTRMTTRQDNGNIWHILSSKDSYTYSPRQSLSFSLPLLMLFFYSRLLFFSTWSGFDCELEAIWSSTAVTATIASSARASAVCIKMQAQRDNRSTANNLPKSVSHLFQFLAFFLPPQDLFLLLHSKEKQKIGPRIGLVGKNGPLNI